MKCRATAGGGNLAFRERFLWMIAVTSGRALGVRKARSDQRRVFDFGRSQLLRAMGVKRDFGMRG